MNQEDPEGVADLLKPEFESIIDTNMSFNSTAGSGCKVCDGKPGVPCDVDSVKVQQKGVPFQGIASKKLRGSALSPQVRKRLGERVVSLLSDADVVIETTASSDRKPAWEKDGKWKERAISVSVSFSYAKRCSTHHPLLTAVYVTSESRDEADEIPSFKIGDQTAALQLFGPRPILNDRSSFFATLISRIFSKPKELMITATSCGVRDGPSDARNSLKTLLQIYCDEEWELEVGINLFRSGNAGKTSFWKASREIKQDKSGALSLQSSTSRSDERSSSSGGLLGTSKNDRTESQQFKTSSKNEGSRVSKTSTSGAGFTATTESKTATVVKSPTRKRKKQRAYTKKEHEKYDNWQLPDTFSLDLKRNGESVADDSKFRTFVDNISTVIRNAKEVQRIADKILSIFRQLQGTFSIGWSFDFSLSWLRGWLALSIGTVAPNHPDTGRYIGVGRFIEFKAGIRLIDLKLNVNFGLRADTWLVEAEMMISMDLTLTIDLATTLGSDRSACVLSEGGEISDVMIQSDPDVATEAACTFSFNAGINIYPHAKFGLAGHTWEMKVEVSCSLKVTIDVKVDAVSGALSGSGKAWCTGVRATCIQKAADVTEKVWPKDGPYTFVKGNEDSPWTFDLFK